MLVNQFQARCIESSAIKERSTIRGGTISYERSFTSQDLAFLDGLLRQIQAEGDLEEGIVLNVEIFTDKTNSNYAFGHITVAYDDNKFRFDILDLHKAVQNPEERIPTLVRLVNSWTGITSDWGQDLAAGIDAGFHQIEEKAENFNETMRRIREEDKEVRGKLKRNLGKIVDCLEEEEVYLPKKFRTYVALSHVHEIMSTNSRLEKIRDKLPLSSILPVTVQTDRGDLFVQVVYQIKTYRDGGKFGGEDNSLTVDRHRCRYIVDGQLAKPDFNVSFEALSEEGFAELGFIKWARPYKQQEGELYYPSDYHGAPRMEIVHFAPLVGKHAGVSVNASFRKSKRRGEFEFCEAIRKHFNLADEIMLYKDKMTDLKTDKS